jgi:hypothetical protein
MNVLGVDSSAGKLQQFQDLKVGGIQHYACEQRRVNSCLDFLIYKFGISPSGRTLETRQALMS